MARKKKEIDNKPKVNTDGIVGLVGSTSEQAISETLEINYMPYAMSKKKSFCCVIPNATNISVNIRNL